MVEIKMDRHNKIEILIDYKSQILIQIHQKGALILLRIFLLQLIAGIITPTKKGLKNQRIKKIKYKKIKKVKMILKWPLIIQVKESRIQMLTNKLK
jgi:hypothetical protein